MNDLYLIYIHEVGVDYSGTHYYEFIFNDTTEGVDGEGWDSEPASGNPEPPNKDLIKQVGRLTSEIKLVVAQNNEQFSMWDVSDGVLSLAWEDLEGLEEYPEPRLVFKFGMPIKEVTDLLYERDLRLEYKKELKDV